MTEEETTRLILAVEHKIEKTVNGKIVAIGKDVASLHEMLQRQNEKTDVTAQQLASHLTKEGEFQTEIRAHMEEVRPYLQGATGFKMVRSFLIWVAGGMVAWAAVKNNFKL